MPNKTYKYSSIVPLIGGITLAARQVTGDDPENLITYSGFQDNEKSLRSYLPHVPYEILDKGGSADAGKGSDFITALCPCAGLSTLGTGDDAMRDKANHWMFETAKHVLGTLKPKVFWGENAPAMFSATSARAERVRDKLLAIAHENGYTASFYFTSTTLHGVPQRRHRTFYFFWQEQDRVPVLPYWKKPHQSWQDYLAQVPATATQHSDDFDRAYKQLRATRFAKWTENLHGPEFPDRIRERMRADGRTAMLTVQDYVLHDKKNPNHAVEMLEWFKQNNDDRAVEYMTRIINKRSEDKGVWDDSPSIFLPEGIFNALIGRTMDAAHPTEHRSLTIRESMHMMALPHDFELVTKSMNQICQNVPVCTAADMQRGVVDYLNGKLPFFDGAKVVFQDNFKEAADASRIVGSSKLLVF